jgi:hypothetical protein
LPFVQHVWKNDYNSYHTPLNSLYQRSFSVLGRKTQYRTATAQVDKECSEFKEIFVFKFKGIICKDEIVDMFFISF